MPAAPRIIKNVQIAREIGANVAITSSSTAELLTTAAHGLPVGSSGQLIKIAGHTGSTPDINGTWYVASVPSSTTFTIAGVDITVGGTGGTLNLLNTGVTPAAGNTWRRLNGKITLERVEEMEEFKDVDTGVYADTMVSMIVGQACKFSWEFRLDTDQFLLVCLMSVAADVTPTGGGADRTWTFSPATVGPAKVDSYTWEFNETDGAASLITRANFVICTGWTVTLSDSGVPMVKAEFFGRAAVSATVFTATTPGGVPALDGKHIPSRKFRALLDATWAGLGTTQLGLGQLYGVQLTFGPFVTPDYFLDGRATMDHSSLVSQKRNFDWMMDLVVHSLPAMFVSTEQTAKAAGTKRFLELEGVGAVLGGSFHKVEFQMSGKHLADSLAQRGEDRNGNLNTRAHLSNLYDATGAADMRIIVVSAATAMP